MRKLINQKAGISSAALLKTATGVLLLGLCGNALAASDSADIKITGKVVANTCTLDTAGSDMAPDMGTVAARDLKGLGTTLALRDIKIHLTGCGADITRGIDFVASGTADTGDSGGFAFKNSSASNGVGLRFYKTDKKTPFKANGSVTETITTLRAGENTVTFAAAFVATSAAATAGAFATTVNLKLNYK